MTIQPANDVVNTRFISVLNKTSNTYREDIISRLISVEESEEVPTLNCVVRSVPNNALVNRQIE